ncbi:hypothetical protein BN946_scf185043.g21 [Trametes cinnabarina]|uniref:DUF202 domain-containing protein n=1 Tax=Pycnoporus cinnabarinus TaxID=5643 RepID=A0A060SHI4_PYCCI|nr:hypothetical protein BN946_scf185043.g21 [Trametes cinnabarina]
MSLLEPTVLTKAPATETPETLPSPPPSRLGTHSREDSADPFKDPPESGERRGEGGATRPSYLAGEPFTPVFTNDSDDPPVTKGTSREETPWRRYLREWKLLLMLENSGSVARDHLASERTFLAYVRTSLTLSSAGVGLVQLFSLSASTADRRDLEHFAKPLGATMIAIGLYTLWIGVARYFLVQGALIRGVYPIARVSVSVLSFAVLVMVIAIFIVILLRT